MTKLYTVTDKAVLDRFGWDIYMGEPRVKYPGYVMAAFGLWYWWHEQRNGAENTTDEIVLDLLINGIDSCKGMS